MNNIIRNIHEQMKPDNRVTESLIDQIHEGNKVSHVKRAGYRWAFVAVPTALAVLCFAIFFVGNRDEQIQSDTNLETQYAKSSEHYDYITPDVVDDKAEEEDAVDDEDNSISYESSETQSQVIQSEPTQIGYEWVSDTEIMSTDGVISSSYEYKKEGNMLYVTVTITNNGDSRIVTSFGGPHLYAETDLTEQEIAWNAPGYSDKINAGESKTFDSSWELEEGWSTADVSFYFRPRCTDEANNIEYGMDNNGNGINDNSEEEYQNGEYSLYENDIGVVEFTLNSDDSSEEYSTEDDPTKSDVTQLDVDSVTLNADFAEDGSYLSESRPDILLEFDEAQKDAMMLALDTIEYNGKTYKYNNEVYASSKAENLIGTGTLNADGIQYSAYIYTIAGEDDKIGLDIEDWKLSIFELVE